MQKRVFHCFVLGFVFIVFCGCTTSRRAWLLASDFGERAAEYRGIQGEIRAGEGELAVTGAIIEQQSGYIASGISELEQSIIASQGTSEEIGTILQRVRGRRVPDHLAAEYANKPPRNGE